MTRVAAIDCGTNSLRLLVADRCGGVLRPLHRELRIVRLGAGVAATGRLADAALVRTADALADYGGTIGRLGAERVRFVATSAARDAANRDALLRLVEDALGVPAEIVSGAEEAALSLRGAATAVSDRPDGAPLLVIDIGGGSTELVIGAVGSTAVRDAVSLDVGCVRLTETFFAADPPTAAQVDGLSTTVRAALTGVPDSIRRAGTGVVVGVAGTVTTVSALANGLTRYDRDTLHGSTLSVAQVRDVTARLLAWNHAERAARPVVHPGRVDVIAAGAVILRTITEWASISELVASETDILDGIALTA